MRRPRVGEHDLRYRSAVFGQRQQELIGHLARNTREGFESLEKQMRDRFSRSNRSFGRNDLITLENTNLHRSSEHYGSSGGSSSTGKNSGEIVSLVERAIKGPPT